MQTSALFPARFSKAMVDDVSCSSLRCLDLSRRGISELPELNACQYLQCLYLEGNSLTQLPSTLFTSCPNLHWLDLRNNLLATLPPSINLLRDLKTLLLQGNQLVSLPPELGELMQLSGLGLADNPLTSPPAHVVRGGTNAVLGYLRDQLESRPSLEDVVEEKGEGEDGRGERKITSDEYNIHRHGSTDSEEEENWITFHHHRSLNTSILNKHIGRRTGRQPLVLPKQAQIHPHPPPSPTPLISYRTDIIEKRSGRRGVGGDVKKKATGSGQKSRGGEKKRSNQAPQGTRQEKAIVHVPTLSSEEKLRANIEIEKQRSKECLEQWRAEARIDHLKSSVSPTSPTVDTAPYATDRQKSPAQESEQDLHLLTSPLRLPNEGHGEAVRERIERYNQVLQSRRKQAGLITEVSSDLLEAERRLAEALAQRDEVEERKKREYRLTAFTADSTLL